MKTLYQNSLSFTIFLYREIDRQRKSTIGFNIWNVMLDISGGTLSVLQQLMDSAIKDDWSAIAGDPVKVCILLSFTE